MPTLVSTKRWTVAPHHPELEAHLAHQLHVAPLVARVMIAQGIRSVEAGRAFLTPSLERDWADPFIIPGMTEVVSRLEQALHLHQTIAVFGDFDVDGITSTCLLTEALRALGATVHPFIPRRKDEGYGMSKEALDRVIACCSPDVVVTVDNGIAAKHEAPYLLNQGIDLVVTDHHEPSNLVPVGVPIANPKFESTGPSRELAGAGVALKVVHGLGMRLGAPHLWKRYTEVAALGTVADMMQLTPENRALVADGIACMRTTSRPGFIALAALSNTDLSAITTESLSFSLIPRLNAAGRMSDPALALSLLMETDPVYAGKLASELEAINQERRAIEAALTEDAIRSAESDFDGGLSLVVAGEGWHEGVKGIVASRLAHRFHVPSILFSIEDGQARGSGRSVGNINLFDAVGQCSDVLTRFGGHAGAVGLTCPADKVPAFRHRLNEVLSTFSPDDFEDRGEIAGTAQLSELTIETIKQLSLLEPFGQGNPVPLFAITGVTMSDRAAVGKTAEHLRFTATDGRSGVSAIMFRAPQIQDMLSYDGALDVVCSVIAETWQGRCKPKLMVRDILVPDRLIAPAENGSTSTDEADEACPALMASCTRATALPVAEPLADERRYRMQQLSYEELSRSLIHAVIGSSAPHAAQLEALQALADGQHVLSVMGTGRGKSLIFQVHAAREALLRHRASIFVYPLRALVADQAMQLKRTAAKLGLHIAVLTGESSPSERQRLYADLSRGTLDVVMTTPEYLALHSHAFAVTGRVAFVAFDEIHHITEADSGTRSAYGELARIYAELQEPQILACTATATPACMTALGKLPLHLRYITDETVRNNLCIDDDRDLVHRDNRLVSVVATGEQCVVYVNAREQSVALVRTLRRRVSALAHKIAYYHAGLTRAERAQVEAAFRAGDLCCIVSTSAFGEGVNLPGIRHVVLYHMPYSEIEFNQMSGRAGRDGETAHIHLMYSPRDARINEHILWLQAPERERLVVVYRALRTLGARVSSCEDGLRAENESILALCKQIDGKNLVDERLIDPALGIFEELGLLQVYETRGARVIQLAEAPQHVDLMQSIRYLEGLRARRSFEAFRTWALKASVRDMLAHVNRPLLPSFPEGGRFDEC
ncbi:single-stranded-DNA-specific exonuclease RecJ [Collinsella sp. zg1085]|uniref:single-stranded-DNA-specific exonuclease RecJ n=1 Tax=Collinsella sp. zg1085 TaxID=2844380 RepID=UPI001C0D5079|nr:single-stranded-DNA-specific exonuclease RecJ [Collinsella sp. zg1085]QWT18130.1 single-stranded-DNA-specific exonuclease RecJ [Collinsella sp. zg1085]